MKSSFYYQDHYLNIAQQAKEFVNSKADFLSEYTADSPRAVGDAIQDILAEKFKDFLGEWCTNYDSEFGRRAMADIAFTDKEGFYSVVDVKTHRMDTEFNRPNLISVERLSRFYESDNNVFAVMMVTYSVNDTVLTVDDVKFVPVEYLDWNCLTIGALGWGQLQIANSNKIAVNNKFSRKEWMLQFCHVMLDFYPNEILKINERIDKFKKIQQVWKSKDNVWD